MNNMYYLYLTIFFVKVLMNDAQDTGNNAQSGSMSSASAHQAAANILLSKNDTDFYLYTKETQDGNIVIPGNADSVRQANFDVNKKTIIATHGFEANSFQKGLVDIREAYMKVHDVNFFTVDWRKCANLTAVLYPVSAECCYIVGGYVADFIEFLQNSFEISLDDIHLIGHSLGAQAMSQVSNRGLIVSRFTGLDPTQVLFWGLPESERIDKGDAKFVDVIHTNINLQGWNKLVGTSDFFPNGGDNQPNCGFFDIECNHEEAFQFYANSIYNETRYPSVQCDTLQQANTGNCNGPIAYMGIASDKGPFGIFYIKTQKDRTSK